MADPTQIWGTYDESTGGAGTGGPIPNDPDPDGTYAQCNDIEPDAPNLLTYQTWVSVKECGDTTASVEWVLIDSETYPIGNVYRVSELGSDGTEQCVYISDDYAGGIGDGVPPDLEFPQGTVICGGYVDCDDCTAQCYKITPCSGADPFHSNNSAYAALVGSATIVAGVTGTVATESDISLCCPNTRDNTSPSGDYADCDEAEAALNPDTCPDPITGLPSGDPPSGFASSYTATLTWGSLCLGSSDAVVAEWNAASDQWATTLNPTPPYLKDRRIQIYHAGGSFWVEASCNISGGEQDALYRRTCGDVTGEYELVAGYPGFSSTLEVS